MQTRHDLLSTRSASAYTGVSEDTLARWRRQGIGPRWVRIGPRLVRYPRHALDQFLGGNSAEEATCPEVTVGG